jgi:hypothetical protein
MDEQFQLKGHTGAALFVSMFRASHLGLHEVLPFCSERYGKDAGCSRDTVSLGCKICQEQCRLRLLKAVF